MLFMKTVVKFNYNINKYNKNIPKALFPNYTMIQENSTYCNKL